MYRQFLLGLVCLQGGMSCLQAASTWIGGVNDQLLQEGNWSPSTPPQPPSVGDLAIFGQDATSYSPSLGSGEVLSLYQLLFTGTTNPFTFSLNDASQMTFGITNDTSGLPNGITNAISSSNDNRFYIEGDSSLLFLGTSSATQGEQLGTGFIIGSSTQGAVTLQDQATAGFASFLIGGVNTGPSLLAFRDTSSAERASIRPAAATLGNGIVHFHDTSTAGQASCLVGDGTGMTPFIGVLRFFDQSVAGEAQFLVGDITGQSTIEFLDNSSAESALITIKSSTSSASTHGNVHFRDSATAANARINVGDVLALSLSSGSLYFHDNATADHAYIHAADHLGSSTVHFYDNSTAANAILLIGTTTTTQKDQDAKLFFHDNATAGESSITVSDAEGRSEIYFQDYATAGQATITLGNETQGLVGQAFFADSSTAGEATFFVQNTSTVQFADGSSGGQASFHLTTGGTVTMLGQGPFTLGAVTSDPTGQLLLPGGASLSIDYNGEIPIEIAGSMGGSGASIIKTGTGTLLLNGPLLGNLLITSGRVSGTGSIQGNLQVSGGIFAPGQSPGTMTVSGDYEQSSSSTYLVQIQEENPSLILVGGSALLENAPVDVVVLEGTLFVNRPFTILQTEGGIQGVFADPSLQLASGSFNPNLLSPQISYTSNQALLILQTTLTKVAKVSNQRVVAERLDSLSSPSESENALLSALIPLSTTSAKRALDQLSGSSYANWKFLQNRTQERILDSLYEPLRPLLLRSTCATCCDKNFTSWVDGSVGRSFLQSKQGIPGLSLGNYGILLGAHGNISSCWTLGFLADFAHNHISYYHVDSYGSEQNFGGGLYSIYRPDSFYLLTNILTSYGENKIHRFLHASGSSWSSWGKAKTTQVGLCAELGVDLRAKKLLLQPFVRIQGSHDHLRKTKEQGSRAITLTLPEQNQNSATSRLGFHITGFPDSCIGFFGLDCAWQCLLTSTKQELEAYFQSFGDPFDIQGVPLERNSLVAGLFTNLALGKCWKLFSKASGQLWKNASSYDLLIGIESSW